MMAKNYDLEDSAGISREKGVEITTGVVLQ